MCIGLLCLGACSTSSQGDTDTGGASSVTQDASASGDTQPADDTSSRADVSVNAATDADASVGTTSDTADVPTVTVGPDVQDAGSADVVPDAVPELPPAPCDDLLVEGGGTTLEFAWHDTLGIVPVALRRDDDVFSLVAAPLWTLSLWTATADSDVTVDPKDAQSFTCTADGAGGLDLRWFGLLSPGGEVFDVQVVVTPSPDGILFDGAVDNPSPADVGKAPLIEDVDAYGVGAIDLPHLAFADLGTESELITGLGAGLRIDDPVRNALTTAQEAIVGEHPRASTSLPLWGFAHGGAVAALTIAESAPERYAWKAFRAHGHGDRLELGLSRLPDAPYEARSLEIPGTALLRIVPCQREDVCWFDLASWYRGLRLASGELQRGPLRDLPDAELSALTYDLGLLIGKADLGDPASPDYGSFVAFNEKLNTFLGADAT
ncbi:MAG: hypothetical protein QF464_17835, partial [Myxococcota bacterium]|nr:hypothetical protein [Myxococcota bacterium]